MSGSAPDEQTRGWLRWRQHIALVSTGLVVGGLVTFWDFRVPTRCEGALPCIDFTGVATAVFWIVFSAHALVSTAIMLAARRAKAPFFGAHIATACTVVFALALTSFVANDKLAHKERLQHARLHFTYER